MMRNINDDNHSSCCGSDGGGDGALAMAAVVVITEIKTIVVSNKSDSSNSCRNVSDFNNVTMLYDGCILCD